MFFIRLNSTLVITSHTLKNVEKTHYDTIRVCYGNNGVAEYQCRGYADKAFAKLLDTMSATEALTVATIINEAPVPPGMFVSKELPPRVSGEDLVIDVEGILRSVKKAVC